MRVFFRARLGDLGIVVTTRHPLEVGDPNRYLRGAAAEW